MKHAERFFEQIRATRATGAAVPETSYYPALDANYEAVKDDSFPWPPSHGHGGAP